MINIVYPLSKFGNVNSPFGPRTIGGKKRHHNGIDINATVGTDVIAIANGTVVRSGEQSGYGNIIVIKHKNTNLIDSDKKHIYSAYAHLSKLDVTIGDEVEKGEIIGLSGGAKGAPGSGNSTGPHLHFELRNVENPNNSNYKQDFINPGPIVKLAQIKGKAKEKLKNPEEKIDDFLEDIKNEDDKIDIKKIKEKFKEELKDSKFREKLAKKLNLSPDELEDKLEDDGYLPTMVAAAKEILGSAAPVIFTTANKIWGTIKNIFNDIKSSETAKAIKGHWGKESELYNKYLKTKDSGMWEQEEKIKKIIQKIL